MRESRTPRTHKGTQHRAEQFYSMDAGTHARTRSEKHILIILLTDNTEHSRRTSHAITFHLNHCLLLTAAVSPCITQFLWENYDVCCFYYSTDYDTINTAIAPRRPPIVVGCIFRTWHGWIATVAVTAAKTRQK